MHTLPSSASRQQVVGRALRSARQLACVTLPLVVVAACSDRGVLEPGPVPRPASARAGVIVTPDYSTFDTRAEFNAAGSIDQLDGFEEFSGAPVYLQPTPWAPGSVTYASDVNAILGPGAGLGITSNSLSAEFGSPIIGQFAAGDAFTLFGADLTMVLSKTLVDVVVYTNQGSYTFSGLDVPLSATGRRFFGVALSRSGEFLTGFRVSPRGPSATPLLDDVAVGHVGPVNAAPEASAGGPYTGDEGSAVALAFGGTDGDGDTLTFAWDLGDGTTGTGPTPPSSHVYADDGSYEVMLAVADGRGGVDTARTTASVANVAPTLAAFSVTAAPLALVDGGVAVPVSTTYADPGTLDAHTATLDCGVGTAVASDAPNGAATGVCTFSSPGVYTLRMTVADDDGGTDSKAAAGQVVVYDAAAGWVTGGGWITSPAGTNLTAPAATGKLTFGFVARYQAEASIPSGSAEVKLTLGKLDFRSAAFDWLVVTGNTARCQGRGTLDGVDGYGFALTAVDGASSDAIHVRIWNLATGATVYDSRPGESLESEAVSALGGGSIQIHSR